MVRMPGRCSRMAMRLESASRSTRERRTVRRPWGTPICSTGLSKSGITPVQPGACGGASPAAGVVAPK
eukprot:199438-Chlamydomonas_euryale.AAC.1